MAIREWWIEKYDESGLNESKGFDCIKTWISPYGPFLAEGSENIHVIEATDMPTKEEINTFLMSIENMAVGDVENTAYDKIIEWLEKLSEE